MPWDEEYHQKQDNLERFGVSEPDQRITESVCCELSKLLTTEQSMLLSDMARKWIAHHATVDAKRGNG